MSQIDSLEDYVAEIRKGLPPVLDVQGEDDDGVWVVNIRVGGIIMKARNAPPLPPEELIQQVLDQLPLLEDF